MHITKLNGNFFTVHFAVLNKSFHFLLHFGKLGNERKMFNIAHKHSKSKIVYYTRAKTEENEKENRPHVTEGGESRVALKMFPMKLETGVLRAQSRWNAKNHNNLLLH